MNEVRFATWADYKRMVDAYAAPSFRISGRTKGSATTILYRGHANAEWKLSSTLERAGISSCSFTDYQRKCITARRIISNFEPRGILFEEECCGRYETVSMRMPNYEYLAFLRHHGFPSPLLDWTESPYVAAFFAFNEVEHDTDSVAIYVFQEHSGGGKVWSYSEPAIFVQGHFASVHERHALQQCWYTASMRSGGGEEAFFCPHEEAFGRVERDPERLHDVIQKVVLPASERRAVMDDLRKMNVTPYTLFRSLDSLIATVSAQLFPE